MLKGRLKRIIEIKEKMMEDKEREIEEAKARKRYQWDQYGRC
jgi:hypothetical protein